jgi:hypothetical protein
MELNCRLETVIALRRVKSDGYPMNGSQSRSGRFGEEINVLFLSEFEMRFVDCAALPHCADYAKERCISLRKVKLSLRAPGVWGSRISRQSAHEGQPYAPAVFTPKDMPSYSFLLDAESIPILLWRDSPIRLRFIGSHLPCFLICYYEINQLCLINSFGFAKMINIIDNYTQCYLCFINC